MSLISLSAVKKDKIRYYEDGKFKKRFEKDVEMFRMSFIVYGKVVRPDLHLK